MLHKHTMHTQQARSAEGILNDILTSMLFSYLLATQIGLGEIFIYTSKTLCLYRISSDLEYRLLCKVGKTFF